MVELPVEISQDIVKVEILERKQVDTVELDKAEVIISGGRGIASDEDFKMLEQ
ncbi:MAG: FAD-binding protein, partial [Deltaproteobacteria bacterium]|nr:FAD-binding protein [Deltaproteobacteria bacterium]